MQDSRELIEQAIAGTPVKDKKNPFEVVRVVRSFDPCLACAIHLHDNKKKELIRVNVMT